MEDIKTNFDKILADFSSGISHNAPKKLVFDHLINDSLDLNYPGSISKRRKLSMERNEFLHGQQSNDSIEFLKNTSTSSLNNSSVTSTTASPWETRRLKADLAEAQARTASCKQEIERLYKLRSEEETLHVNEVKDLKRQCEFSSSKILDLEKHLNALRKREQSTKSELNKTRTYYSKRELTYQEQIQQYESRIHEMDEHSRVLQNDLTNEVNRCQRHAEKLEMELGLANDEIANLKAQVENYITKSAAYDETKNNLDKSQQSLAEANSKIKELEFEIASFGDWKEMAHVSQSRLAGLPKMDKEMDRLQRDNKNLLNTVGNKLLLEEQVYDLKGRLDKCEMAKEESIKLKVQMNALEEELKEWKRIAQDHCVENSLISPYSLRSRIEEILQKDILLSSEHGSNRIEKHCFESQIQSLQKENEMLVKNNNDLKKALQHHKNIMMRVQKKLMLVAKERDCYKQLVENFEKDLTVSNTVTDVGPSDAQLRVRMDMLEKTLTGYKEMVENLETDLRNIRSMPGIPLEMTTNGNDYEHLKKEIDDLKLENDRLKRRKEELELEIEHRCLRGDFNMAKFKVVHLANNPASEAYENTKNEIDKLRAEVERLKRRNKKLEDDQEEMTTRLNETQNITINLKEINTLRQKIESQESKITHMKELYKSSSLEFREVAYMLLGYKIDRVGNVNYRVSSMYAESENEYLNFRLNESGVLDMLETEYSTAIDDMMQKNLAKHKSLPVFLSHLTTELFNRTTVAIS